MRVASNAIKLTVCSEVSGILVVQKAVHTSVFLQGYVHVYHDPRAIDVSWRSNDCCDCALAAIQDPS